MHVTRLESAGNVVRMFERKNSKNSGRKSRRKKTRWEEEKKWKGEVRKNAAELLNRKNWRETARHIRD